MWTKVLKLSASPRKLLRSVLALDDSPHAVALCVAVGMFVGMTPTVGIQTVIVLAFLTITRRFFYFNTAAAMAATYVSNPITMVPLYYFWYKLGAMFVGGQATLEQFELLLDFEGMAGWWQAVCTIGAEVGIPLLVGAAITAPIASAISYPACYAMVAWVRRTPDDADPPVPNGAAKAAATPIQEPPSADTPKDDNEVTEIHRLAV